MADDKLRLTIPLLSMLDAVDDSITPSADDVEVAYSAGWPWRPVAEAAKVFLSLARGGAEAWAFRLISPDGFPEVLFQLGILGEVLIACDAAGATVTSLRPIGDMTNGPVYQIFSPETGVWEVWVEASRCWDYYGVRDVYCELATGLVSASGSPFLARSIRPDVLIAQAGREALVMECKYPTDTLDPGYVGRGMYQAAFYANQLKPAFPKVTGIAVGPTELVQRARVEQFGESALGVAGGESIRGILRGLVSRSGARAGTTIASPE